MMASRGRAARSCARRRPLRAGPWPTREPLGAQQLAHPLAGGGQLVGRPRVLMPRPMQQITTLPTPHCRRRRGNIKGSRRAQPPSSRWCGSRARAPAAGWPALAVGVVKMNTKPARRISCSTASSMEPRCPGVPTPMVSPRDISWQPRSSSRSAGAATRSGGWAVERAGDDGGGSRAPDAEAARLLHQRAKRTRDSSTLMPMLAG